MCQSNTDEKNPIPKLTPLEYLFVNVLRSEGRDIDEGELVTLVKEKFGVNERKVKNILNDSLISHHGYVVKNTDYAERQHQSDLKSVLAISNKAVQEIYPRINPDTCTDGGLLRATINAIADDQTLQGNYCIMGSPYSENTADLIIYHPTPKIGMGGFEIFNTLHPDYWSNKVSAIEIEADPTKHKEQIYKNYVKNTSHGMSACFIVFSERAMTCIIDIMAEHAIGNDSYELTVMDPEEFIRQNNKSDTLKIV